MGDEEEGNRRKKSSDTGREEGPAADLDVAVESDPASEEARAVDVTDEGATAEGRSRGAPELDLELAGRRRRGRRRRGGRRWRGRLGRGDAARRVWPARKGDAAGGAHHRA
jgi:hypothetical protein